MNDTSATRGRGKTDSRHEKWYVLQELDYNSPDVKRRYLESRIQTLSGLEKDKAEHDLDQLLNDATTRSALKN